MTVLMTCSLCGASKDMTTDRVPMGWKWDATNREKLTCSSCWQQGHVLRAITFPVAGPVDATWDDLRTALADAWQRATALSNWGVQELMKADVTRTSEMAKLPKMPDIQLYALRKGQFDGWSQSAAAILRAITQKYRARRFERIWLGETSLPNMRFPQPFPMHNAAWKASYDDGGRPLVTVKLPMGQFVLRLRGGNEFRRQLTAFRQIVDGRAVQGELALYRQRVNSGDHRSGSQERDEGGQKFATRIMCKMVAWLPRESQKQGTGTLLVTTAADAMLVAINAKDEKLFTINGDHVRRWTIAHQAQLQRWSDDSKMEVRRGSVPFASRREAACDKFNRRMDTAVREMAAQVVNYAARRRFAVVRWIKGEAKFVESCRWSALVDRMQTKCNELGIEFQCEGSGDAKNPGSPRKTITQGVEQC